MHVCGDYFYGNKISDYGIECGYVDYATLAKAFDAVLANNIIADTESAGLGYWEQESGFIDYSEEIGELRDEIAELEERLEDADDDAVEELTSRISELQEEIDVLEYEEAYPPEIFQYFIVSDGGARILEEVDESVFYNDALGLYVWGVCHWGTSWSYVCTDIKIIKEEN